MARQLADEPKGRQERTARIPYGHASTRNLQARGRDRWVDTRSEERLQQGAVLRRQAHRKRGVLLVRAAPDQCERGGANPAPRAALVGGGARAHAERSAI